MIGPYIRQMRLQQNMSQAGLCEGICSVSYLSKIEANHVQAPAPLLRDLLDVLHVEYDDDPNALQQFSTTMTSFFEALTVEHYDGTEFETLLELCHHFQHSPLRIDALIFEGFLHMMKDTSSVLIDERLHDLNALSQYFDPTQHYLVDILWAQNRFLTSRDYDEAIYRLRRLLPFDSYGFAYDLLAGMLLDKGDYREAIEVGLLAYAFYVEQGNVIKMTWCSHFLSMGYSNLSEIDMMLKYYQRTNRLNKTLKNSQYDIYGPYNVGATYLQMKLVDQAYTYLIQAYNNFITINSSSDVRVNLVLQKLVMCCSEMKRYEEALTYFNALNPDQDLLLNTSIPLMELMMDQTQAKDSDAYVEALQACLDIASTYHSMGHSLFYVRLLIDVYQQRRQYKKAIDLMKKFNIS